MIIAGGTYHELCQFPPDTAFFGSGVRAAAATQSRVSSRNQLYTFIDSTDEETLDTYAATFDFDVHTVEIPETVTFDYLHNHSNPIWSPSQASAYNREHSEITGDAVLRFGLIEGSAVVSGQRVVYDPQAADPVRFNSNGSTAKELALVLNEEEAKQLTGKDNLESIFVELTGKATGADVVVLKRGARGALVRTPGMTTLVPAFQTESVWGIGSGDVFSAVFAAEWAENRKDAKEAALSASKATAYYCGTRQLPNSEDFVETKISGISPKFVSPNAVPPTIYLAGPFFDIGERFVVEEVKHILESEGANVVSPVHDIGRASDYETPEEVAQKDLEAIERADMVFALLDQFDSGTHFELGYARKTETPVVGYANDFDEGNEIMIAGSGCEVYTDLASAIFNAIWRAYA